MQVAPHQALGKSPYLPPNIETDVRVFSTPVPGAQVALVRYGAKNVKQLAVAIVHGFRPVGPGEVHAHHDITGPPEAYDLLPPVNHGFGAKFCSSMDITGP